MSLQVINTFGYEIPRVVVDTLFAPPDDTFTVPVELQTIPFFAIKNGDLWRWNTVTFIWEIVSAGSSNTIYSGDGTLAADRTVNGGGNDLSFINLDAFVLTANSNLINGPVTLSNLAGNGSGVVAVDNNGLLSWIATPTGINIYNSDGTLTAVRTVTLGGNNLDFISSLGTNLSINEPQTSIAGYDAAGGGNSGQVTASTNAATGLVNLHASFDAGASQADIQLEAFSGGSIINYTASNHAFVGPIFIDSIRAATIQQIVPVTFADSPYSATQTKGDIVLLVNASGGNVVINLGASVSTVAKFTIKKVDSSVNTVTIDGNGGETIDGDLTPIIEYQYTSITIVNDNSNWHII